MANDDHRPHRYTYLHSPQHTLKKRERESRQSRGRPTKEHNQIYKKMSQERKKYTRKDREIGRRRLFDISRKMAKQMRWTCKEYRMR